MKPENYDFECWVIKYGVKTVRDLTYQKDSLKDERGNTVVPLCWNHKHYDPSYVLGNAVLEHRDDGVYAYCTINDSSIRKLVEDLIIFKPGLSISPFVQGAKITDKTVTNGFIREVSLVLRRDDEDEAYRPILNKGESR